MSLNRNGAPRADHREAGRTADLLDPAGAYIPGSASAPTTDPARAYSGKRAPAPTLAAGAYIPGTQAASFAGEFVDPAGTYEGAGARAPTIDPARAYSGPATSMPTPAIVGTYLPVAGSKSAAAKGVDPVRAQSSTGASAATIDPARSYGVPAAGASAPAGANSPVSEANSAAAEIVDRVGVHSLAGASPATAGPARAYLGAGAGAPVLSAAGAAVPVSGTISAAAEIRPAGASGPARAPVPLSAVSASPALDPHGAPPGYYYQAGATAYIEDPAGTYSLAGATTPTADPGGYYSLPRASAPTEDPAGYYSSPYALDRLFLETSSATPNNRVLTFKNLTAVENYYGATSDEAALASQFFTTYGSSAKMLVVRFPLGGNRAHLYGGKSVSNLTVPQLQAINGTISVTSQGYHYSARINLANVTSPTLAATEIQAALNENLPVAAVTTGSSIVPESASFTASTNGLLLDVTSISSGSIQIGALISGAGIPAGTQINSQFTGTPGGVGLYSLYVPAGVISSEAMTESYGVLTVDSVSSGTVKDGEQVTGPGILPDTAIEGNLGGNTWLVNFAQTVASENMTMTGAPLSVLYTAITGATKNSGYFSIQQNGYFNWDTASLTYAKGTAAAALGLTKASGAWLQTPGENIASEAAFMSMIAALDPAFGSFQATWPQLAQEDPEAQAALAAWAASTDGQFQFLNDTSDAPPAGTSAPTLDPPGTWSGAGASLPTPAAPGTYIPNAGATSVTAQITDPVGYFSLAGASAPTPAQPGYYVGTTGASTETPAAAGTYIPFSGATSAAQALPDPAGFYCPAGASAPIIDPAGFFSGAGASAPTPATPGTYIPFAGATSALQATEDQPGWYSLAGASAPTEAQPGYYVPGPGASSETKDDPGFYTPLPGATAEIQALAPGISGAVSGQTIAPLETDTPFSSVTIGDPNQDTSDTLTITMTGGTGTLTDGAGFDGLTLSAPGVYVLSGTAAEITSELDALIFTPSAGIGTRTFTLTDASSAGTSASDTNTTVNVESNPPPVVVSVPTFLANKPSLDQTPGGFDVLAAASQITASLDQLDDPHINSITILDNGEVGASVQQLTSDATAIGKLKDANSSPVLLAVHDTTANIEAGLSTLVAHAGQIASITASDAPVGVVVVSVATFLADQSALDKIVGGFAISETAADVAQNLDALTAALSAGTNITSIELTDGGVPTLTISLAQALNDTLALNKITTPHSIVISDSAPASITSTQAIYLSGENIAVNGAPVIATGTVATMKLLGQIVTSLLVSQGYTLAVVDTAANIEALGTPQIKNLVLRHVLLLEASDTSVALTASLAVPLEGAKMVVTAPSGSNVTVTDIAANLSAMSATTIEGLPAIGVSGIVSTTGPVTISLAQALALEGADLRITVPAGGAVTISDSAANIGALSAAQFSGLPAIGVGGVSVSDPNNLTLSVAQTTALETSGVSLSLQSGYSALISDSAADIETLTAPQIGGLPALHVTHISASDTAVSLTVAEAVALEGAGVPLSAPSGDTVQIFDTTAHLQALTASQIDGLTAIGVTGLVPIDAKPARPIHANDLTYSSTVSGSNHFIDLYNFEASYSDLIAAFGTNETAMHNWYNSYEPVENRPETFDGLDYVASYGDLTSAFAAAGSQKAVQDDGALHYISYGEGEGRTTSFNGLDYIASYGDLINAFGANNDSGAYHYIEYGHNEDRTATFDGLDYIASYPDLIKAFGTNEQAGAVHFIDYGFKEGRTTNFDGLSYIAEYTDLMNAFGANNDAGTTHYIGYGFKEHRTTTFTFDNQVGAAAVGAYEAAHPDLQGKFATNDAFFTAYIDAYKTTGTFLA